MYIYQDNLESKRIITRFLNSNDILIWSEFFSDKEAAEFLPNFENKSNLDRATHMINKQLDRYKNEKFGLQVIIDKNTNAFIGLCGLLAQEVEGKIEIEVGYHMFKKYWGQGYATEAAKLFIDFAFKNKVADTIISIIDIGNIKSQKVALKNGLTIERKIKWYDLEDVYVFRIRK
jgi:RimJ/RimL family protein N-acetyltransferase